MSRKAESKGFNGGFIPPELKSTETRGRKESASQWQGLSDREESLLDPRWNKRPPIKGKKTTTNKTTTPEHSASTVQLVQDAGELFSSEKKQETSFPKNVFGDDSTSIKTKVISKQKPKIMLKMTCAAQTETINSVMATRTDIATNNNDDTRKFASAA